MLMLLLLIAMLFAVLTSNVSATTLQFTVPNGEETLKTLSLSADDHVVVEFTVVGQTSNVLDFYVTDPDGNVQAAFSGTGNVNYPFICNKTGDYVLHFDNTIWSDDKLVTLDYEIQHYIFGMPQMLFLTMIIVLICVAAVAVFILMGKPR
jgi:hypothetical protein